MNTIRLNVLGEAKAASSGVSIKNQDKSVEITENGVTELTADSGYTGLGKVTINANVQGGGSSSGGSEWRYMDLRQVSDSYRKYMLGYAHIISLTKDGSVYIGTSALSTADSGLTINAIGINMSAYMKDATNTGNQIITAADFWYKDMGGTLAWDGFMAEIGASELSEEGFLNIGA